MADRNLDEYKSVKFYADNTKAKKAGFSKFNIEKDYYFCRYIDGGIAMISQAYTSEAGRDNGIESVKKNEKLAKRYVFEARGTKEHGFALKAGNGQEVAISPSYGSLAKAEQVSGRLTGKTKAAKATSKNATPKPKTKKPKAAKATATKAAFTASDQRIENYKPIAFYKKHGGSADGFNSFDQDGASYFHYNEDGEIVLISESYTSKRGRDNGIASVTKNMKLETAYQHHVHKNGKHYFDINAANRQEIATSRWYSSEAKALQGATRLRGENAKPRTGNVEQNYMPLAFYKKATKGKKTGFESFKGEDGEHYFAYFEDDKIALISEGYPTAAVRDKGLASVEKNMKIESRYVYGKGADGKDGFALRAGNNKEIARSVGYGSAAAAAAGAAYLLGTRRRVKRKTAVPAAAALASGSVAAAKPKTVKKRAKPAVVPLAAGNIAVAGLGASAAAAKTNAVKKAAVPIKAAPIKVPPVAAPIAALALGTATFAGAAAVAATPKAEPVAAAAPVAAAIPAAASTGGGGIWGWLKWVLMGLIALLAILFMLKSCVGGEKAVKVAPVATTTKTAAPAAMVTCWNGSKAKNDQACPTKVSCWDDSFATSQSACPVQPVAKDFECWDGTKAVDQVNCPARPVAAKTAAGTTIAATSPRTSVANATTGKMTAPSITGRVCAPSSNTLFNVSASTPKSVSYLGSNPQFGNSLSLTPDGFYRKLATAYRMSANDKAFLDLVARSLGYGSFGDMDASMFSNDTLANGTSGLLGFGSGHALQYSTLNVADQTNLEAFKVRSANGTDVHFMKRCGNYMYVCQP